MFTWKPIFKEIVDRLPEFQFKNAMLVDLMVKMHRKSLKVSSFLDQDATGTEFQLEESDPFTFLAIFNRGVKDCNRIAMLAFLKEEWQLKSELPSDFAGLPLVNLQKSWFMPFRFRREPQHVSTLWKFFVHVTKLDTPANLNVELFDACLGLRGIGLAYLTMGMFWTRPDIWLSLDRKNLAYAQSLGVDISPRGGGEYVQWLSDVVSKARISNCDFSHSAHLLATDPVPLPPQNVDHIPLVSEIAPPFNRLFADEEHASVVLEYFEVVLSALRASSDDPVLALTLAERGKNGGQMRVIYGRWAVFSYRRRAGDQSFQVLMPEKNAAVSEINRSHTFVDPGSEENYILVWLEQSWFIENFEVLWPAFEKALARVVTLFGEWEASPYAEKNFPELYELIRDRGKRTRLLRSGVSDAPFDDVDYWVFAPGEKASLWGESFDNGVATIGWEDVGDLNQFSTKEEISDQVAGCYPENNASSVASMLWSFSYRMKPGDVVFAKAGLFKVCGWGIVCGDYRYDEDRDFFNHTLPVDWKSNHELMMPDGVQLPGQTLTLMTGKKGFLDAVSKGYENIPGLSEPVQDDEVSTAFTYSKEHAVKDLFIPEEKIDRIIRQLRRKKNIILQGAPGTGKTFVARRIAYLLMGEAVPSRAPIMQFHQSTTYEDFVQGYRPDQSGGFKLKNGGFFEFCEFARKQPDRPFVFVIDEINRGNLSKIFGELLMLLEHDKRGGDFAVPLTYAQNISDTFSVPANLYLIGTMNTADRSLSLVDYALRRRFAFESLEPEFDSPVFAAVLKSSGATDDLVRKVRERMVALNHLISSDSSSLGKGYQIGHSFFVPIPGQIADNGWLDEVIECEIIPLLGEYWGDDSQGFEKACKIARGEC